MAGRRRQVNRSKPSSMERETGNPASRSETSSVYPAIKASEEKAAKQAARLEKIRISEERDQFRRGGQLQTRQQEARKIREAKALADAKAAADAKKAAYAKAAADAKAAEDKRIADANREVKTVEFTPDQLVDKYNNSRGAQEFKLTSRYDPKTNTFIEDVSAFGFEGDAATKTYTPEEFIAKLGYKGDDYNQFNFSRPQQQDPEPTPPDTPVSSTDDDFKAPSFGAEYDPDPKLNSLYNSLSFTIQMSAGTRALTQEEAAQQSKEVKDLEQQIIAAGGQPYKYFTNLPFGGFRGEGPDPTRGEYDPMTGRYTDKDDQPAPVPSPGPAPTPPDMPPGYPYGEGPRDGPKTGPAPPGFTHSGGPSTMALVPFYNPTTGEEWTASSGGWRPAPGWVQGEKPADWKPPTSADPAPTLPDMPVQPEPDPLPESPVPKPPTFVDMDPLKNMRDQFIPRNILGQSYDPQVREDFVKKMQSGANITSTPSYQMPTSPIPQTQFGGYGQPMPMSPLAPYAGLGAAPMPPTDYNEPYDEDALPGGPSGPSDGGGVT